MPKRPTSKSSRGQGRGRKPAPAPPSRAAPPPKAPRQRDYKAEYARRVRGTAKGSAARQAKRGHKPPAGKTESQVRREREHERSGRNGALTSGQKAAITRWFQKQSLTTSYVTFDQARETGRRWIARQHENHPGHEWARFERLKEHVEELREEREWRGGGKVVGDASDLEALAEEYDLEPDEAWVIHYG